MSRYWIVLRACSVYLSVLFFLRKYVLQIYWIFVIKCHNVRSMSKMISTLEGMEQGVMVAKVVLTCMYNHYIVLYVYKIFHNMKV